jgi:hypothetical protein
MRIAKPFVLTFIGLRARGLTIFAALAQAVRHHIHRRTK